MDIADYRHVLFVYPISRGTSEIVIWEVADMPRGDNPKSKSNLIKPKRDLTAIEQRKRASKAGKKSAEVRRSLKTFRQLDEDNTTDDERLKALNALKKRMIHGDIRAFEIYRDTMGMKPKDNISVEMDAVFIVDDIKE